MKGKTFGLLRRFFVSSWKDKVLQNIQNHVAKPKAGISGIACQSSSLSTAFTFPYFKNLTFGSGQNLVVPSLLSNSVLKHNKFKLQIGCNPQNEALKRDAPLTLHTSPISSPEMAYPLVESLMISPIAQYSDGKKALKECLLDELQPRKPGLHKVTVVGGGCVGVACTVCILQQKITNDLCLVDVAKDKVLGEITDLTHGSTFFPKLHLKASADFEASAGSKVCVITAGSRRREGQSRLDLLDKNVQIIKSIIPPLVKYSPDAVLIIVSNPVDIFSYVSWKLSGFPKGRVIGSGCELDSSRFRVFIGEKLGLAPSSCHGWIIGEHGDSSVAVWSSVNVAGVKFMDLNPCIGKPDDPENWAEVHKKVVTCAAEVSKLKGHTSWGIGMMCAALTNAVLYNTHTVHSVSVHAKGYHGIEDDIFLSLPASIGINGVHDVIKQTLTDSEKADLLKSAKILYEKQGSIKF